MFSFTKIREIHTLDKWTLDGEVIVSLDMTIPYIEEPLSSLALMRINRYYAHFTRKLKNYCSRLASKRQQGEYRLCYTVSRDDGAVLSIYCDIFRDMLLRGRLAVNWDAQTAYPLMLQRFTSLSRRELLRQFQQQINSETRTIYFKDCYRRLRRFYDPDNFYITDDGLKMFYQPLILSPLSEGVSVFSCQEQDEVL